ncbi:MAG: prepilin-type N-terminal cleavage/methylation domain-containing protein [Isosphaeraceae bacterium]|nr:prepilin-type N-terminal cleavage/methylation domain-containing protein [Isosphaeraceae bacterium]
MGRTTSECRLIRRTSELRGVTLVEVVVVVTILGILVSIAAPSYRRAVEQARVDVAAAHLRSIWAAQRMHYLEERAFAIDFTTLEAGDLLDTSPLASDPWYVYLLESNGTTFTISATRTGSSVYSGTLVIGPDGVVTGSISTAGGPALSPGFQ